MKAFVAAICMLFLAGCVSPDGKVLSLTNSRPVTETIVLSKCPALKKYTKEQLQQAAAELESQVPNSIVSKMVIDYGQLREACRAIEKQLKK